MSRDDESGGDATDGVVLRVRDVVVGGVPGGELRWPRLELARGEAVALLGPSGAGKTTLLDALFGLDDVRRGLHVVAAERQFLGVAWPAPGSREQRRRLRDDVCVLPQDAHGALDPLVTIEHQLARAVDSATAGERAAVLVELGLDEPGLVQRYPHQISGGQARRVLLAIALLRRPTLLVVDEPSAGLDAARVGELARTLNRLRRDVGTAVLLATHETAMVAALEARTFVLEPTDCAVREVTDLGVQPWPRLAVDDSDDDADREADEPALVARGLGVRVGAKWLLRDVDFEVGRGEIVALVGPSGGGKTTLGRVLAGFIAPTEGTLSTAGTGPQRARDVQMLFQNAFASLTPGRRVDTLVAEVAAPTFDVGAVAAALGLTDDTLNRVPEQLSGGERRRVALLRALAVEPRVLFLDEPTASLDRPTAIAALRELLPALVHANRCAIVLATHDDELATALAGSRTLVMVDGRLRERVRSA